MTTCPSCNTIYDGSTCMQCAAQARVRACPRCKRFDSDAVRAAASGNGDPNGRLICMYCGITWTPDSIEGSSRNVQPINRKPCPTCQGRGSLSGSIEACTTCSGTGYAGEPAVDHPAHYGGKDNQFEAIKVIEAWGLGFGLGNTVKYICRAGKKSSGIVSAEANRDTYRQDLEKALWYLKHEIERLK